MNESTELLLRLIGGMDNAVTGRTMMQKIVFILRSKFHKFQDYSYSLHYYGPFSRDLADELDRLRLQGMIVETPVYFQDKTRYDIGLTNVGRELLEHMPKNVQGDLQSMISAANGLNSTQLGDVIDEAYQVAISEGIE